MGDASRDGGRESGHDEKVGAGDGVVWGGGGDGRGGEGRGGGVG